MEVTRLTKPVHPAEWELKTLCSPCSHVVIALPCLGVYEAKVFPLKSLPLGSQLCPLSPVGAASAKASFQYGTSWPSLQLTLTALLAFVNVFTEFRSTAIISTASHSPFWSADFRTSQNAYQLSFHSRRQIRRCECSLSVWPLTIHTLLPVSWYPPPSFLSLLFSFLLKKNSCNIRSVILKWTI